MEDQINVECSEEKKARLKEYEESLNQVKNNADVLRRHGINPDTLLKLLFREINVLTHQLHNDNTANS